MKSFLILILVSTVFGQMPRRPRPNPIGLSQSASLRQDLDGCLNFETAISFVKLFTERDLNTFLDTNSIEDFREHLSESFDKCSRKSSIEFVSRKVFKSLSVNNFTKDIAVSKLRQPSRS